MNLYSATAPLHPLTKQGRLTMKDLYRIIIIPDTHHPHEDIRSLKAVEGLMADWRFDEWIHLGDLMDFDMISRFNKDVLRKLETRRLLKDYEHANTFLDRHQKIIKSNNKNAKFTLLEGNHEYRMEVLIDHMPNLEGLLEVDKQLYLEERGINWVRSWSQSKLHKVGKLYFHHGDYVSKYHANKMLDTFGVNIAYGHTHDSQSYERVTKGDGNPNKAWAMGHLADVKKLGYTRGRPNNWTQMVGIAEIRPDGNFTLLQIPIVNHCFSYAGKVYKG